jgi:hypothetical protein
VCHQIEGVDEHGDFQLRGCGRRGRDRDGNGRADPSWTVRQGESEGAFPSGSAA